MQEAHRTLRGYGCRGYPPEHLRQLSFQQSYEDREANAGRHQVQQGGLRTHGWSGTRGTLARTRAHVRFLTWACLKVCMTKMVRPSPKM